MSEARHNPVLAGQTAVITGGASGIGKSIVQRFLEAGASCLAADLNEEALAALKQELAEYGDKLDVVKVDVCLLYTSLSTALSSVTWSISMD